MVELPNGYSFEFVAASGALGYDGRGYPWEYPFRWVGLLDPSKFAVITKTLTFRPRKGNLRWLAPWRCVRLVPGGTVNAVGLTNPGIKAWFDAYYPGIVKAGRKIILSIMPETHCEASTMGFLITKHDCFNNAIVAVEVNASCPNTKTDWTVSRVTQMVRDINASCNRSILVKLGWQDPYIDICRELDDGTVAAFDLINTVPWGMVFPTKSPLAAYGLEGGVSGTAIGGHAMDALLAVKHAGISTPIISGGGVYSFGDVRARFLNGASAVSFGTLFLRQSWKPNQLVRQWERRTTDVSGNPGSV